MAATSPTGRRTHPRPVLVASKCLEQQPCRYNGQIIRAPFVLALEPFVELRSTCPEVEIGLGTPRDPIRLVELRGRTRLLQPNTGRDITTQMDRFSASFVERASEVDGFILKSRSPSCGIKDTKVYGGAQYRHPIGKGAGHFAKAVVERFPHAAIEDEARITNSRLRHHFLVKLYMRAALRAVRASRSMAALVRFQAEHRLQLMAANQTAMRALGRLVANGATRRWNELMAAYEEQLGRALAYPARDRSVVNVLMHALGYAAADLSAGERKHLVDLLEQYRARQITLSTPLAILRSWIRRSGHDDLERQTFLEPYPLELMQTVDDSLEAKSEGRQEP